MEKIIKGNISLEKDTDDSNQEDISDMEEDEEEPQFLDMDEMERISSGGHHFRWITTSSKKVIITAGRKRHIVAGRFLLTDPWWEVTCKVKSQGKKNWLRGYQAYTLRTSVGIDIVSLFLEECGVAYEFKMEFIQWLQGRCFNLAKLPTFLKKFVTKNEVAVRHILPLVVKSDAFAHIKAAAQYPQLMKYLPTLLPRQFKELLGVGKKRKKDPQQQTPQASNEPEENLGDSRLLAKLEEIISSDIWKLGFKYVLSREINTVGCEATLNAFKECKVLQEIPQLQRDALVLYDNLKKYCRDFQSTYIEMDKLSDRLPSIDIGKVLDFLRGHEVVMCIRQKVILRDYYTYETGIVECLKDLIEAESWCIALNVEEVLRKAMGSLDPDQVQAAKMICSNAVTVISGKGGCGKTTVIRQVFKAAKQTSHSDTEKPVVLLTAPTGRAAALLSKGNELQAYTMHQVLYDFINWSKGERDGASKEWKFSDVQVLVVDEGSLVGVRMLHSLLSLLTTHAELKKFILLGDVRQLPSIEPGNVLYDLFHTLRRVNWSIEMRTNHRAESQLIVENAELISKMGEEQRLGRLKFDAKIDFNAKITVPPSGKKFILIIPKKEIKKVDGLKKTIGKLLEDEWPGLQDHVSSQFVTFRKNDCDMINELCCQYYSDHPSKRKPKGEIVFQCDDKVCCTRNAYVVDKNKEAEWRRSRTKDKDDSTEIIPKERLCNGEIFFIENDTTTFEKETFMRYLTLNDKYGKIITVNFRDLKRECKPQHAWARTIHTFQGSEVKTVVYVVGAGSFQTWRHVYTAVTRGRERVYMITEEKELRTAIEWWDKPRKTRLKELLSPILHSAAKRKRPSSEIFFGTAAKQTRDAN